MANQKKAQVTNNEIESDEQLLLVSVDDMLKTRKKGIEDFNKFFHTSASVRLNPKYDRTTFTDGEKEETDQEKGGANNE